jgi:hypothetical protein
MRIVRALWRLGPFLAGKVIEFKRRQARERKRRMDDPVKDVRSAVDQQPMYDFVKRAVSI